MGIARTPSQPAIKTEMVPANTPQTIQASHMSTFSSQFHSISFQVHVVFCPPPLLQRASCVGTADEDTIHAGCW